jgi:hypothetical protein
VENLPEFFDCFLLESNPSGTEKSMDRIKIQYKTEKVRMMINAEINSLLKITFLNENLPNGECQVPET